MLLTLLVFWLAKSPVLITREIYGVHGLLLSGWERAIIATVFFTYKKRLCSEICKNTKISTPS